MRISTRYGSHLPVLMQLLPKTKGSILELGMGVFSTPYLHYYCTLNKQHLTSYDNDDGKFTDWTYRYKNEYHDIKYVKDWNEVEMGSPELALVDVTPDFMRKELIKKLTEVRFVVIHDANPKWDKVYHYSEIFPLFKYKYIWTNDDTNTGILSNIEEVIL